MKTFALLGNPNSGKTTLYNSLTGSSAHVGNWPGVTVEKRTGTYKKGKEVVQIVDLPGIYSLSPYTSEEVISRNFILDEHPDCVINIVDATNLERNLYLTTQALEIDVPLVIALNMMDEVLKRGRKIDAKKLEKELGVPVVEISALKEEGMEQLMNRAIEAAKTPRKARTVIKNRELLHLIGDINIAITAQKVDNPLFHAIKLVEKDEQEVKNHPNLLPIVEAFQENFKNEIFGTDFEAIIADARYQYITEAFKDVVVNIDDTKIDTKSALTKSDKIDKVLTNRWLGIPLFLLILFTLFHFVFSENFLFLGGLFANVTPSFANTPYEGVLWNEGGVASPGVFLQSLVTNTTDLLGGLVSEGLNNVGAPNWLQGFVVDGALGGLFAVFSFVPQILLLFLFFQILEDSGYMARVAFILDRIFRKFGLSGRAFMPLIMGFGCSVPAMTNTRTLASEQEKDVTIKVIPFFSCGAKLPILVAIAGGIVQFFGVGNADIITYGMYLLGMTSAIVAIIILRNTTKRGKVSPFIMELPNYHLPQFKSLMIHSWDKLKHFIAKAFTIILASTIVIWFLSSFRWDWTMASELIDGSGEFVGYDISESILHGLGQLIQPLFTPMGFGSQIGQFGWVFAVAAITGLIAKENVIATFGVLAASLIASGALTGDPSVIIGDEDGIAATISMIEATGIGVPGLLAFIAFNMTTIPCFAAVATAKAETQKEKFRYTLLFWIASSFIIASLIYLIGTWWWTIFIALGVAISLTLAIVIYNKTHPLENENS
ncbi:MAG: ferrous iron transporter B [Erysipelotrichaceae bacterium]|nr:ferrous iron transporter B [Erysipelotrichaceae bacterium]